MPRTRKREERPRRKLIFAARISVRLDDDVLVLANECAKRVDWASQSHAVNAALRRALLPFAPPTMAIRIDPFEQLVFNKKLHRK